MLSEKDLSQNQRGAADFILERQKALLLADVGVGKTIILLTALAQLFAEERVRRALVVGPMRVARWTWPDEIAKWAHTKGLTVGVASGEPGKSIPAAKRAAIIDSGAQITTLNYESLPWLLDRYPFKQPVGAPARWVAEPWPFDVVVFDEVDKMKRTSGRFKQMKRYLPFIDWRIAMSGTPTPNTLLEIWAAAFLVDNGQTFGTAFTSFQKEFFYPDNVFAKGVKWLPFPHKVEELYAKLAPFTYRIKLEDEVDMPPVREVVVPVTLSASTMKVYRDMEKKFLAWVEGLDGPVTAVNAGAKVNKLAQLASGFVYSKEHEEDRENITTWLDRAKVEALAEKVDELGGAQCIVVYWYKAQRDALRAQFGDRIWELNDETIARWNKGEGELLMLHPASAGHGLNLHEGGCHYLAYLTSPWSGGLDNQVIGRARRRGQKERVVVLRLVSQGTIDERIVEVLRDKKQGMSALLDAMLEKTKGRAA